MVAIHVRQINLNQLSHVYVSDSMKKNETFKHMQVDYNRVEHVLIPIQRQFKTLNLESIVHSVNIQRVEVIRV